MPDYIYLSHSYITFGNVIDVQPFVTDLNAIDNYDLFFDEFFVGNDVKQGDRYELTYHADSSTGINCDEIMALFLNIVNMCKKYGQQVNLKFKSLYDGEFDLYVIIKNNEIHDLTSEVNFAVDSIELSINQIN